MKPSLLLRAAFLATLTAVPVLAQGIPGDAPTADRPAFLHLKAGQFDPARDTLDLPAFLRSPASTGLWIVQFRGKPTQVWRDQVEALGAEIHHYVPDHAYVVRMDPKTAALVAGLESIRHIGAYEPAFRIDPVLVSAMLRGQQLKTQRYNIVTVDKRTDKPALVAAIRAMGGRVDNMQEGSILLEATLTPEQLVAAANLDQVLWIDLWSDVEEDMDNARIQGGGNYVETVGGYTGQGINAHIYEGVEANHPDFTTPMTRVGPTTCSAPSSHGHATAGIVLGNGTSNPAVRGMAPDARGFYTTYVNTSNTCATSRNSILGTAVNSFNCMLTTASWGNSRTTQYTSISADADDVVFDHRIPWTQSQSNAGNQNSRPQAWGKNIISVGGVDHFDNSNPNDDSWAAGNASTGPAADGRIKPDLCAYYDSIGTSDRTGSAGYSSGNWTSSFGGTSGATPIVAGHNALAIQMYTDGLFGANTLRIPGGSRFQNRPYAQTVKAMMIATARQYFFNAGSSDNRREHQGWGFPNLRTLYDNRNEMFIVPEDTPLQQGDVQEYLLEVAPGEDQLKICMTFLEPAGNPAASMAIVNDLSLKVTAPDGTVYWGNHGLNSGTQSLAGGSADTRDSVEVFSQNSPAAGIWRAEVIATRVSTDAHVATGATDATFALAVNGAIQTDGSTCAEYLINDNAADGTRNVIPFGGAFNSGSLNTVFNANNGGSIGGAVYFDLTVLRDIRLDNLSVNTGQDVGRPLSAEIFVTAIGGSSAASRANPGDWTSLGKASGLSAGTDNPSTLTLDTPSPLPVGTYGVAIVATNFDHDYTNGNGTNQSYSNTIIQIDAGSASNTPFTGSFFDPRVANVEVGYTIYLDSSLQTGFISNNGGSPGGAVYFDAVSDEPLFLFELDVNTAAPAGSALNAEVYALPDGSSYNGNETNAGAWTLVATATGTAAGVDLPSRLTLSNAVQINASGASGQARGLMIVATDFAHRYTNGNGSNETVTNGELTLNLGSASNTPFSSPLFNPRVANVEVYYGALGARTGDNIRFQQVIPASTIGQTGRITGLAFAAAGSGEIRFESLQIRMTERPAGLPLSTNFAFNMAGAVTVFDSTNPFFGTTRHVWPVTADEWNNIGLSNGFTYNGGDLVIEIVARGRTPIVTNGGFRRTLNSVAAPRIFNEGWTTLPAVGTIDDRGLRTRLEFGCAELSVFGANCGDLETGVAGSSELGGSIGLFSGAGAPTAATVLHLGLDNGPFYPLDLSFLGAPGCFFHNDALAAVSQTSDPNGSTAFALPVPMDQNLLGAILFAQHLQLNAGAPGGVTASGYARLVVGTNP